MPAMAQGDSTPGATAAPSPSAQPSAPTASVSRRLPSMDDTDRGWSEPALDEAQATGDVAIVNGDSPLVNGDVPVVNTDAPVVNTDAPAVNTDAPADALTMNADVPVVNADSPAVLESAASTGDAPPDTVASRPFALEQSLVAAAPPVSAVEPHAPTEPHPALVVTPADAAERAPRDASITNGVASPEAAEAPANAAEASPNGVEARPNGAARSPELAAALLAAQAVVEALPPAPKLEAPAAPRADAGTAPTLVPRPAMTTPYVSIPPPATVPSVGSISEASPPNYSTAPPVVVTRVRTGSPVPITEADLADDLRAPGLFASFGRAKPGGSWLALGGAAVLIAFGGGLALGRGTAPVPLPPVPVPAAVAAPPAEANPTPAAPATTTNEPATAPPSTTPSEPAVVAQGATERAPASGTATSASLAAAVEANLGGSAKEDGKAAGSSTFNAKAARTNLELSAGRAAKCHVAGDPAGAVTAAVTFGTNGRVTDVNVTTKGFAGTKTAQCIANKLRTTRAPAFSGSPQTLDASVTLRSAR